MQVWRGSLVPLYIRYKISSLVWYFENYFLVYYQAICSCLIYDKFQTLYIQGFFW